MKGFFEKEKTKRKKQKISKKQGCYFCGLRRKSEHSAFEYRGNGSKKILIIDGAPSKKHADVGTDIDDINYNFIRDTLDIEGIDIQEDCWYTYAAKCYYKPYNKMGEVSPNRYLNCCRSKLLQEIRELKPEKIICLGYEALYGLIGHRLSARVSLTKKEYEKWVGWQIPDQELEAWVFPTYSISETVKADDEGITINLFNKHIEDAIIKGDFPKNTYLDECSYIDNVDDAIGILKRFIRSDTIAFDYETTGIKPHAEGHKIFCIGISNGIMSYSFPIFDDENFKKILRRCLTSPKAKWGHNMQFEQTWTAERLGYFVEGWDFDGMLGAHMLDNRPGITGLKFQAYVNFGIIGYDDSAEPLLTSDDKKNANAFNALKDLDYDSEEARDVITYCAMDAHLTWHLCAKQKELILNDRILKKGYSLLHDGALTLAEVSMNGIKVNEEALIRNELELEKAIFKAVKEVDNSPEASKWDRADEEFNFNSSEHLRHLLFDILGYEPTKLTKTELASTDVEALENIDSEFTNKILEYKRLCKIKNTYIAGIKREAVNGYIHPGFSLHLVASYRSSSQNPNAQNYPKQDEYATRIIRECLGPHPGQYLVEADYSGAETRVSVDYNGDKKLYEYLFDENTDMHKDIASDLFMKPPEEITKEERFVAKNGITFAFFYGSSGYNAAARIWNSLLTPEMKAYLKTKGIRRFEDIVKHLEKLHDIFWNERFKEYGQWKKDMWDFYKKYGYIKFKTGFKATGRMYFNQTSNYQIQGSAFHCLLWSLIRVHRHIKENNLKSKIIFQIHDSVGLSVDPAEWEELKPVINEIMCIKLAEKWRWVKVPMRADFDIYKDSWANQIDEGEMVNVK